MAFEILSQELVPEDEPDDRDVELPPGGLYQHVSRFTLHVGDPKSAVESVALQLRCHRFVGEL